MKTLPYLLLLSLLLIACHPLRIVDNGKHLTTDSTVIVTHRDTLHIQVRDTITTQTTHHVTLRDTTYTRERIVITYDPATGNPLTRTEDRDISQYRTLDSLYHRMLSLQHSLDSLRVADSTQLSNLNTQLSTTTHQEERGDAARTPWQSFLHFVSLQAWPILFLCLVLLIIIYFIRTKFLHKL